MRTGRSIMALQGHVQGILTMDFSPDGFHLATGSEDHSCRIWDLRKRGCVYTLPAHKSLISQVRLDRPLRDATCCEPCALHRLLHASLCSCLIVDLCGALFVPVCIFTCRGVPAPDWGQCTVMHCCSL